MVETNMDWVSRQERWCGSRGRETAGGRNRPEPARTRRRPSRIGHQEGGAVVPDHSIIPPSGLIVLPTVSDLDTLTAPTLDDVSR